MQIDRVTIQVDFLFDSRLYMNHVMLKRQKKIISVSTDLSLN